MSKIARWFRRRFKELDLLEKYFPLLFTRWQAALWGGSVLAVAFGWHFVTADWPYPVKVTACVTALFFAGYYVWRADHVRLMPGFQIDSAPRIQETPTNDPHLRQAYIQLIVRCATDAPVEGCIGHLLRVSRRWSDTEKWEPTEMNESVPLGWSLSGYNPITIYPKVDQRLNICFRDNKIDFIQPTVFPAPVRWREAFDWAMTFRFDIRISARECAPEDLSVAVRIHSRKWNDPYVEILDGEQNG